MLYAALLWLADRSEGRLRVREIGASAGLNLRADRYAYHVAELERRRAGELTVVWHSVVRQHVPGEEWAAVIVLSSCGDHGPPVVWNPRVLTAG